MTHTIKSIALLATLGTLAACGGGGGGTGEGGGGGGGPIFDDPTPPSITANDVNNANSFITGVSNRRDTPNLSILPGGTATYTGEMVTGLTIDGASSVDGMIGDVRMTAQLFGAGDNVTGTVSNIHTLAGNSPIELLSGVLDIDGTLEDGSKQMTATLTGQLGGVIGDGERGDLNVSGSMNGHTKDTAIVTSFPIIGNVTTFDEATGIAGSTNGSISGSETGNFSGNWAVSE